MYRIISKLYNGTKHVGYEVEDIETHKKYRQSIEMVNGLALGGCIENIRYNINNGTLKGLNGNDLRKLKHKQYQDNKGLEINVLIKDSLLVHVNNIMMEYPNQRYLVTDLMDWLEKPCSKVCMLCGLRRTGKTIMIKHAIYNLIAKYGVNILNKIAYINLNEKS